MRTVVCVALIVLCAAAVALPAGAQQRQDRGPGPGMAGEPEQQLTPEQFSERKSEVLRLLDEREKRLTEERACVKASKDMNEMLKCRPAPPRQMGPGQRGQGGPGGPGMDRPPMGGMDQRR